MIEAIAIDYGGVLVEATSGKGHQARIAAELGISTDDLTLAVHGPGRLRWNQAKVGQISEAAFWAEAARLLALSPDRLAWLRQALFEDVRLQPELRDTLQGLRGRYRLALVSNAIPSFSATWRRLGLIEMFDVVINSAEVGIAKPALGIYALASEALGVPPAACLFVDDKEANVAAAREAGFAALRCTNAASCARDIARILGDQGSGS